MTKLKLPGDIGRQLTASQQCIELCDEAGQTIGFFTPATDPALLDPQISEEELDRREREDRTYSSSEVRARLRGL
jgi:hypothetical protein